jgi:tetratricopeptide (TPR) repeat protein
MNDTTQLRAAIIGLLGFAAVEEELLLAATGAAEQGNPTCWAAVPLVAHNTEFRRQQVCRLDAIRRVQTPPAFAEVDHRSEEVYRRYCEQAPDGVALAAREVTAALIDGLSATSDDDLLDPSRNPWLDGRQLWLQIIVRGFWHPTGHLGDYYLGHGRADRAVALQAQAVAVASYLSAPGPARGMAYYNLACAQARADLPDEAIDSLRRADEMNPGLLAKADDDADFAVLRASGRLLSLLGQ